MGVGEGGEEGKRGRGKLTDKNNDRWSDRQLGTQTDKDAHADVLADDGRLQDTR